ncbi:MAG: alpha/beta hydrolase [bacterium]|nr:alpha/beta hydrolase [bacterium]
MLNELLKIEQIPAVVYGEQSDKVYLFVHGKGGNKEEAESFARIACARGYQVLSIDLPGYGQRMSELADFVPWKIVPELQRVMKYAKSRWNTVSLHATSIGAFCSLLAFQEEELEAVLLVSPLLDMTKLIQNMMQWAGVTEEELQEKQTIPTDFGETLDWQYYQYVKGHAIQHWNHPTQILYACQDNLTDRGTVDAFVEKYHCGLTVMEDGEHWFHTPEQLAVLESWRNRTAL